ncbi:acetyltransferase, GNAT family [Leptospira inadai serovar Lyme str. 10]|uniref:Acetyltransferase, GNAT family n=2 Tax=Leptospira inadai serovar Lyme TaxID=293084 RepID=V6HCY6_9LEPT|nr:GNAT family N-acetyltransferase [Leptospira inadai]EQA37851.1 acetyltransferase, GNAT family [Leptospira inadai serovar Lyme str. 10]PNV74669.1 N-acetyltransferase [Leptospira inadai serovar Lyme]
MNVVKHDEQAHTFVLIQDGFEAHLDYNEIGKEVWNLTHTFVPGSLRGKGLASVLVKTALDAARKSGKKIIPSCSYVETYLKRNPDYSDLISE